METDIRSRGGEAGAGAVGARKPVLAIVAGEHVREETVRALLRDRYAVIAVDAERLIEMLREGKADAVLAEGSRLIPVTTGAGGIADRLSAQVLGSIGEGVCLVEAVRAGPGHGVGGGGGEGAGSAGAIGGGLVVWSNAGFDGYPASMRERVVAHCVEAAEGFSKELAEADASVAFSARRFAIDSDGSGEKHYEVVVSPVLAEVGGAGGVRGGARVDRVAAVVWDVTRARTRERKLEAINKAGEELVRIDIDAIRTKHMVERLAVLENKIVSTCHDLMHFDHFLIRVIDEKTSKLELVMSSKGLSEEAKALQLYARREGNGISGYVAATGKSYVCADCEKDAMYRTGLAGARSTLTVPLRLQGKVVGVFNVESGRRAAFTDEDREFAEIFANHVAMALHILDLLVAERCVTGVAVTETVTGEVEAPLGEIERETELLRQRLERGGDGDTGGDEAATRASIEKILRGVASIRKRVRSVASGPKSVLGADRAMSDVRVDPVISERRVLVVDDEEGIRTIIRDVLTARGAEVVMCERGEEAIERLEAMGGAAARGAGASGPTRFDLVVSDIRLPDKNGYEVFAAAREASRSIPVILMTGFGYDPHHSIVRASQEGLQCVLFKPFEAERLLDEVRKALSSNTAQ